MWACHENISSIRGDGTGPSQEYHRNAFSETELPWLPTENVPATHNFTHATLYTNVKLLPRQEMCDSVWLLLG